MACLNGSVDWNVASSSRAVCDASVRCWIATHSRGIAVRCELTSARARGDRRLAFAHVEAAPRGSRIYTTHAACGRLSRDARDMGEITVPDRVGDHLRDRRISLHAWPPAGRGRR
ncbi:hypothetical protein WI93_25515 [Burkholderia vietnamiensis]|nr:hypothetical protein WI93_25515 [Burkholderia vietnamiensis]